MQRIVVYETIIIIISSEYHCTTNQNNAYSYSTGCGSYATVTPGHQRATTALRAYWTYSSTTVATSTLLPCSPLLVPPIPPAEQYPY